jgi:hypothetical protein
MTELDSLSSGDISLPTTLAELRALVIVEPKAFLNVEGRVIFAEDLRDLVEHYAELCFANNPLKPVHDFDVLTALPIPIQRLLHERVNKITPTMTECYKPKLPALFWSMVELFKQDEPEEEPDLTQVPSWWRPRAKRRKMGTFVIKSAMAKKYEMPL